MADALGASSPACSDSLHLLLQLRQSFGGQRSVHCSWCSKHWVALHPAAQLCSAHCSGSHLGRKGDVGGDLLVPLAARAEAFEVHDEHARQAVEAQLPRGCRRPLALVAVEGRVALQGRGCYELQLFQSQEGLVFGARLDATRAPAWAVFSLQQACASSRSPLLRMPLQVCDASRHALRLQTHTSDLRSRLAGVVDMSSARHSDSTEDMPARSRRLCAQRGSLRWKQAPACWP